MIEFDVILEDLGGAGLSQIVLVLILNYFSAIVGFNALATVFIAYKPDFRLVDVIYRILLLTYVLSS